MGHICFGLNFSLAESLQMGQLFFEKVHRDACVIIYYTKVTKIDCRVRNRLVHACNGIHNGDCKVRGVTTVRRVRRGGGGLIIPQIKVEI